MPLLLPVVAAAAALGCDWSPDARATAAASVIASLRDRGYSVEPGVQEVYPSTHFGANPGNPYVVYKFNGTLENAAWTLEPKSAILNIVCTPPTVAYFSWRSYLMLDPKLVFASLGDTLNNLKINTTGAGDHDVYRRTAAIITTGDSTTYNHVSLALASAGGIAVLTRPPDPLFWLSHSHLLPHIVSSLSPPTQVSGARPTSTATLPPFYPTLSSRASQCSTAPLSGQTTQQKRVTLRRATPCTSSPRQDRSLLPQ